MTLSVNPPPPLRGRIPLLISRPTKALPKLSFGWTDDPKYLETAQGDFHEAMFGDDVREHPDVKPIMSCRGFAPAHLVEYPKGEGVYCIMDLVSGEVMRILRPSELEDIVSLLKDESLGGIEFEAVDPENRAQFAEVDARELGGSVG